MYLLKVLEKTPLVTPNPRNLSFQIGASDKEVENICNSNFNRPQVLETFILVL